MNYALATACLAMFCVLGVFDGIYFHLIKFKLHERAESRVEHLIHTARAFLFAPIAILLFVINAGGLLLATGLFVIAVDLVLEVFDILIEKTSRRTLWRYLERGVRDSRLRQQLQDGSAGVRDWRETHSGLLVFQPHSPN